MCVCLEKGQKNGNENKVGVCVKVCGTVKRTVVCLLKNQKCCLQKNVRCMASCKYKIGQNSKDKKLLKWLVERYS